MARDSVVDLEAAFFLSKKALAKSLPRRWRHVQGVARAAELCSPLFSRDDADLLVAAAVLHDIGYSPELAKTGFHPLDGACYLRGVGMDGRLCALIAHHSCAYREAELRNLSAQLAVWGDEEGALRDALWWADMTTTPDGKPTNVHDRIEEIQKRYGPEDLVTFFIRQAKPELVAAVECTEERLRAAGVDYTAK
ncbi:HD domain-containing protein [Lentzea sp. BCCO 10_0061]|uniref:HD domain-containing protein n=1 Tax=Lentzea sokolovensis TaxID=3095429 RepID=A0ABU4UYC5_9PSEU|nr:HD domain-containing protein [Lentzea sp. BCCO 10_0061]MDX8144507.1 HD domain-containing protein [Lentzea sp. BCCO 10_0061]